VSGVTALGPLDQAGDRRQPLEVRRDVRADAGEDRALRPEERVADERRDRARRDRERDVVLLHPVGGDLHQQLVPTRERSTPVLPQAFVGEADGPELPEDADVAGAQVLVQVGARRQVLLGERLRPGEERALALEQALVLAVEDGDEELLLSAEVVVDEGEPDAGRLGDRPRRRPGLAVGREDVPGRVEDLLPRVGPAGAAAVDLPGRA